MINDEPIIKDCDRREFGRLFYEAYMKLYRQEILVNQAYALYYLAVTDYRYYRLMDKAYLRFKRRLLALEESGKIWDFAMGVCLAGVSKIMHAYNVTDFNVAEKMYRTANKELKIPANGDNYD